MKLPLLLSATAMLLAAVAATALAGGPSTPRTQFCYGDQLRVDVRVTDSSQWVTQRIELSCRNKSGETYSERTYDFQHPVIDGVSEPDLALMTNFKALLSTALLAQSQGRDVRVFFNSFGIETVPRGHPDYKRVFPVSS